MRMGPRMRSVRDYIRENPGCTRSDVAKGLGIPPSTASRAVKSCLKYGCVRELLPCGELPTILLDSGMDGRLVGEVLRRVEAERETKKPRN